MLALAGKGRGVLLCFLSVFWVIAGVLLTSRCLIGVYVGVYVYVWVCGSLRQGSGSLEEVIEGYGRR